jgi:hypothetical protein
VREADRMKREREQAGRVRRSSPSPPPPARSGKASGKPRASESSSPERPVEPVYVEKRRVSESAKGKFVESTAVEKGRKISRSESPDEEEPELKKKKKEISDSEGVSFFFFSTMQRRHRLFDDIA